MIAKASSVALVGMDGHAVDVEVAVSSGLPVFTIVGLPDPSIQEARERVRSAIERLEIPRVDGQGVLQVTASCGVAALPASAKDKDSLIAAADAALYRAKRAGKNRVERAEPAAARS